VAEGGSAGAWRRKTREGASGGSATNYVPDHGVVPVLALLHAAVVPHRPCGRGPHHPLSPRRGHRHPLEVDDAAAPCILDLNSIARPLPNGCAAVAADVNVLGFDLGNDGRTAWGQWLREAVAGGGDERHRRERVEGVPQIMFQITA
jgi:hypothetical protein